MSITLRRITDYDTFLDATASPRETAALYFHKQLDPFYDVALAVSSDFFARPHLYTRMRVPPDNVQGAGVDGQGGDGDAAREAETRTVETMARLRSRCGSDELLPSHSQPRSTGQVS